MKVSRRSFIQKAGVFAAAFALFKLDAKAAGACEMVKADDPMAKALFYVADAKTADKTKRTDKPGMKADGQFCVNCSLYAVGKDVKVVDKKSDTCSIFGTKCVAGKGWCMSWNLDEKKKALKPA